MSRDVSEHAASIFRVEETCVRQVTNRADFLFGLFFDPEDGGNMFIRNVG
jgi:hypothetical protein